MMRPIVIVRRSTRLRALTFGTYPRVAAAAMILSRVAGRTRTAGSLRSTRETVDGSTPAVCATATRVLVLWPDRAALREALPSAARARSTPSPPHGGR